MFTLAKGKAQTAQNTFQRIQTTQNPLVSSVRGLKAPHFNVGSNQSTKMAGRKPMYDVHGRAEGRLGILNLNKEHRYNVLSPSFAHEVSRGIGSFYEDRLTKAIMVQPDQGKQWSNGTDFRTMLGMKKEENYDALGNYLQQIYQLQTQVAKTNKPIVSVAAGHAFNSGATLLASSGIPLMTTDSQMAFNECTFGFVPHSGATYYLSRLPSEFGTFLALTGLPIHGTDAAKLGLVDGVVQRTKYLSDIVADTVFSLGADPREFHSVHVMHEDEIFANITQDGRRKQTTNSRIAQNKVLDSMAQNRAEIASGRDRLRRDRNFEESHERAPSSIGDVDGRYNLFLRNEQRKHQNPGTGYLDWGLGGVDQDFHYQQVYQPMHDYLKKHVSHQYEADKTVAFQHIEMIGRCFYPSSIEEIKHNLRQEGTPFAQKCLDAMERNSDLSMNLALKMLRQAISLDYASCLRMEVNVASRVIETEEFDIGVQEVLLNPKAKKGQKHPNAANYPKEASLTSNLDSYFEGAAWAKNISVGAMAHSLLPTRHYYERFGDQVRLWINEESTHQDELRACFDREVKEALQEQGIDVRDRGLTIKSAREHLAASLAQERRDKVQFERMEQIMCDKKLRQNYFDSVDSEVNKLKSMPSSDFQAKVDGCITNVFEQAYVGRLQTMFDKSKEAQTLEKRRMYIRLKRFLFKSRCVTYGNESLSKQLERMENYDYKLPHCSESWTESWRDVNSPWIQKSPLFHLSKAIGRTSISPVELTQEYLTNPAARKQLSMLTIDKEELLKLQDDIYSNPQKYEAIFSEKEPIDWGTLKHHWTSQRGKTFDPKLDDHIYWHSHMNDGTDAVENWPYYREYNVYKNWFSEIEDKALCTLKMAVAQLLSNFDNQTVHDGSGQTKKGQFESLLSKIEGLDEETSVQSQKKAASKSRKITSSKRDYDYINQILDETVCEDPHLQPFLDPAVAEQHPVIADMQASARDELLKLLEITLLDKYEDTYLDSDDKMVIKQRLAELMTPSGMNRDESRHQQLKLIDTYLLAETGKATLKSTIELIKPVYFQYVDALLKKSAEKLLSQMNREETQHHVLLAHQWLKAMPGADRGPAYQKLIGYSKKRSNHELLWKGMAASSPAFKQRNLMASFQEFDLREYHDSVPIEEQKERTKKKMEQSLAAVAQYESNLSAMEDEFLQDARQETKNLGKENDPKQLTNFWNEREINELNFLEKSYQDLILKLSNSMYEIENHFTPFDWLKVYSEAIQECELDMNPILGLVLEEREGQNFSGSEGKSQEEWQELAAAAKYLADYKQAQRSYRPSYDAGMPEFLSRQTTDEISNASLWELALQKKNEFLEQKQASVKADRAQIIRGELADFNRLQKLSAGRDQIVKHLETVIETQPIRVQKIVTEMLNSTNKTYIDFEKLTDKIIAGDDLKEFSELIDVQNLISDVRTQQKVISDSFLDTKLDVQSIEEVRLQTERDSALDQIEKAQILSLIEHVNNQMQYVSNSRRQGITISQFLSDHHFSAPQAFVSFSNGALRSKLSSALGDSELQNRSKTSVDWELDGVRTSPIDHNSSGAVDLQAIANASESVSGLDERVEVVDPVTGVRDVRPLRDHTQIQVLREAKRLTELPVDMEQYKNFYENELLKAMMKIEIETDQEEIQSKIIEQYMNMRFKTCMLNADFADKVRDSDNGHLYMKVLKERVVDELGLTSEAETQDMLFETMHSKRRDTLRYDVDSMYNMQDINNTQAIGYDNLANRSKENGSQFEAAHENVFDKLLADYYLSQRGEYAESNKLMSKLTSVFEEKILSKRDMFKGADLSTYKQHEDLTKDDTPYIKAEAAKKIYDLDVLTHQAVQKGKSGLSDRLRQLSISDTEHPDHFSTQVPQYFDSMDVRKPPQTLVDEKLQAVVNEAFEVRRKLERNMSRRELLAFDKVLSKYMQPENLLKRLDSAIQEEYSLIFQGRQMVEQTEQQKTSNEHQLKKSPNNQRRYNNSIKNEDALFKQMAYGAMVEKQYEWEIENKDSKTNRDKVIQFSPFTFERWYMDELEKDAMKAPREVKEADYQPKTFMRPAGTDAPQYLNRSERIEKYEEDHSLYMENKKEQQDRTALFYILEQFYEHSRENPDKLSTAQDHMKDYFSDPDNTFFFDKNKIQ